MVAKESEREVKLMSKIYRKVIDTKHHKKYNFHVESFDSAMDVYPTCTTRQLTSSQFHDMAHYDYNSNGKGWYGEGINCYEDAVNYLKTGYQPAVDSLKAKMKINRNGESKRFAFQNSVAGFAPVVPLALKGVPNCMIDMYIKPIKTKVVDVYYDLTCSAGTSSQTILNNGKVLLSAITELEMQGYRFNLYAMQSYSDNKSADILVVKIKDASQPMDLKRMSYPLMHTGFFRAIGFDWYSKMPEGKFRGGYGHAMAYEFDGDELDDAAKKLLGENVIYMSGTKIKEHGEDHIKEVLTNGNSKN